MPHSSDIQTPSSVSAGLARDRTRAVVAGYLGWTLDAFDFFLVVFCSTTIAREFGQPNSAIILSLTLTLATRPIGAIIFGLLADRYGRRIPLMANLVFFSIIEILSGLAPNYTTFMILRALFGIGMGGEWGVGASLSMEKVPMKFRGLLSGVLQSGYTMGYLLASVAYFFVFTPYGWRPLFFIGGVPALLAIFVRYGITESKVWEETRHENWHSLLVAIEENWKTLLYIVVLMAAFNSSSHGTQDLYPTFLKKDWDMENRPRLLAVVVAIANVGAIIGAIVVGYFSDRYGRKQVIRLAFIGAVLVIPLWAFAPTGNIVFLAAGGFLIQFMLQGAWGTIPAHLSELSPDAVRGFLPGFGYQCGALIAGTVPFIQEHLSQTYPRANVMSGTCFIIFLMTLGVVAVGPERRGVHFGKK